MLSQAGFVQFSVAHGDKEANFEKAGALLSAVKGADLLILPELCFTGYDLVNRDQAAHLAEPAGDGPTREFLLEWAGKLECTMVAGYVEREGEKLYNSSMMVTPQGAVHNYRKIHLFNRENELFSPGDAEPHVVETPAGRVGMMICFDWFFPEVARCLALKGAQVIAHPSNLVLPYCQKAMYCRSVENRVFTITANRIGTETQAGRSLTFTGSSQVLGPEGEVLASCGDEDEVVRLATIEVARADEKQINPHNHLIKSRRPELYGALTDERRG